MRVVLLLSVLSMLGFSMPENYDLPSSMEEGSLSTANLRCQDKGNLTVNGTIITITDLKIKNVGFVPTSVSYVGYYLSADENFTTDDIYLGQDYVKGLERNETSSEDFMIDVQMMDIPEGEYFVGAILDHLESIEEYDEEDNNDCYWTSPKVVIGGKPDLTCEGTGELTVEGTNIHISWTTITNAGDAPAGASHTGFYLSTNNIFTTGDIFLGEVDLPALQPGESEMMPIFELDVATLDIPAGEYFIGFILDYKNEVEESNEENNKNCSYDQKVKIEELPVGKPNLGCKDRGELTFNANTLKLVVEGTKVQNYGEVPSGAFDVTYVLSDDFTFNTNDIEIATKSVSSIAPGVAIDLPATEVNLAPFNLASGTYYVGILIDSEDDVDESNEADNNDCFWENPKITIQDDRKPNLTCTDRGELIINNNTLDVTIGWTKVKNDGDATAGASQIGFYLSTDENFTTDDILLTTFDVGQLEPGESQMITNAIQANAGDLGLAPGLYFVGAIIDHKAQVAESNENDNVGCSWKEPRVFIPNNQKPNLTCTDRGELIINNNTLDVTIGWTKVKNDGDATAGASQIGFYLSTDENFTTDDILLTTFDVGQLEPGESQMITNAIQANAGDLGLAPGLYFVGAIIDHKAQVAESNENDNVGCSWKEPRVFIPNNQKPNLTCTDRGELIINNSTLDVTIGWTKVTNNGDGKAGASQIGFYLSTDENFTTDDILLTTFDIGALEPGESQKIENAIQANAGNLGLAPGLYFVGAIIDHKAQVAESNENDNVGCSWQEPRVFIPNNSKPNLTCKERGTLSVNGTNVSISNLRITNNGDGASEAAKIGIYLSDNQFFSTGDNLLGVINLPKLQPGQVFTTSFSKNAASLNLPAGDYFVGVIVDYTNVVTETNEDDNSTCSWNSPKVHVTPAKPNLTCASPGELIVTDGTKLNFSWIQVRNNGDARAGTSKIGYYLSTDRNFTTNDIFLGSKSISAIEPGQTITIGEFTKNIADLGLADGTYYAGFIIDFDDKVEESNEADNNDCSYDRKITISNAKPNLVCASRGEIEVNGTKLDISWVKVMNSGDGSAGASKTGFYLSTDQYFTTSDFFIGSVNTKALQPNEAHILSDFSVDVANLDIPAGTYYVGFIIDYQNVVHETNENDNNDCSYTKRVTIPSPKPNLTCHQAGEVSVNGTNVHISWVKVKNTGSGSSSPARVGFYLSTDSYFTTSDYLMGTVSLKALASGEVQQLSEFSKNVNDLGLASGSYHIGIIIDPYDQVHETNESDNNDCSFSKKVTIEAAKPNITCFERGEITGTGSVVKISWVRAKNTGGSRASSSKVGYYLSTDQNFTTNDIFIGESSLGALDPGEVKMANEFTRDLGSLNLSPGEYFIGYIFDYNNKVHETNEHDNNDCFFTSPKVVVNPSKPNLTCKSRGELSVNGLELHHSWGKVMNSGQSKADPFYVGYYLSRDRHFDKNEDIYLGQVYVSALAANQVATLPAINADVSTLNLPSGTYYFGFIIDHNNQVNETNEHDNNDCFFDHPTINIQAAKPDLTCKSIGELSVNGSNVHISWVKVMNSGGSHAGASRIGYYLSTDTNFNPNSDYFIGYRNIPSLSAGQVTTISDFSKNIANLGIPAGNYFLGYYIDYQDKVHESNEHNNNDCYWTNKKVQIAGGKSNLVVKSGGHFSVSGYTLQFSNIQVRNEGNSSTEYTSKLGYYLSRDNVINPNHDILIGTDHLPVLGAGQSSTESESINLSGLNLSSGTYYIGLFADNEYNIHESNESDNQFLYSQRIQITQNTGKPDLACASAGQLKRIGNNQIRVEGLRVTNIGSSTAASSYVGFYLSADLNFTTSDYLIGTKQINNLGVNQTATLTYSGTLPANVPDGTYYVGYIIDYNNRVAEKNESNNNDCYFTSPKIQIGSTGGGNANNCACSNYRLNSFCEGFDTYDLGTFDNTSCFMGYFGATTGSGVGNIIEESGNKCFNVNQGVQSVLMLGNRTSGYYRIKFKMRVTGGKKAYYNILHAFNANSPGTNEYGYEVYFEGNNSGYVQHAGRKKNFSYPNSWFDVEQLINVSNDQVVLSINGTQIGSWRFSDTPNRSSGINRLAGLYFLGLNNSYGYDVDDVEFTTMSSDGGDNLESRSEEVAATPLQNISMEYYPNPVSSDLFVDITTPTVVDKAIVEILNPMGQVVARHEESNVTTINKVFNLSDQPGGMYYIKTQIGDQQIVKPVVVIKQ